MSGSKIRLYGSTSGFVELEAPAVADDGTLVLPTAAQGFGKIIQIVRATDSTARETTSTSFVDVTGMSVTITPQKIDSGIIIMALFRSAPQSTTDGNLVFYQITDSSNNTISGTENVVFGTSNLTGVGNRNIVAPLTLLAYATPATTSAVTYKMRFRSELSTTNNRVANNLNTGQMYAIEVAV